MKVVKTGTLEECTKKLFEEFDVATVKSRKRKDAQS